MKICRFSFIKDEEVAGVDEEEILFGVVEKLLFEAEEAVEALEVTMLLCSSHSSH
jgi:hypothetical protein